jgi:hypothetical protein
VVTVSGSDDEVGNFMQWDVNYLEVEGLDYKILAIKKHLFYKKGLHH